MVTTAGLYFTCGRRVSFTVFTNRFAHEAAAAASAAGFLVRVRQRNNSTNMCPHNKIISATAIAAYRYCIIYSQTTAYTIMTRERTVSAPRSAAAAADGRRLRKRFKTIRVRMHTGVCNACTWKSPWSAVSSVRFFPTTTRPWARQTTARRNDFLKENRPHTRAFTTRGRGRESTCPVETPNLPVDYGLENITVQ